MFYVFNLLSEETGEQISDNELAMLIVLGVVFVCIFLIVALSDLVEHKLKRGRTHSNVSNNPSQTNPEPYNPSKNRTRNTVLSILLSAIILAGFYYIAHYL